jgi:hypothetical protein
MQGHPFDFSSGNPKFNVNIINFGAYVFYTYQFLNNDTHMFLSSLAVITSYA